MGTRTCFGDYDRDGFLDLYVARYVNFSPENYPTECLFSDLHVTCGPRRYAGSSDLLYRNNGGGGDFDHSGHLSIFTTNFSGDVNTLSKANRDGTFSDQTGPLGLGASSLRHLGWGAGFIDYDNDTWLDLIVVNGHLHPEVE